MFRLNPIRFYHRQSQLRKNVFSGSVYAGLNMIILLVSYPIFLRFLGTELYGLWATTSVVVVFSRLGELGMDRAVIKFVAEEYGRENPENITSYMTTAAYILSTTSLLVILLSLFFSGAIANFLGFPDKYGNLVKVLIPMMGVLSGVVFVTNIAKGTLSGLGRIDLSNYIFLFGRLIGFLLAVIFIIKGLGVWGLYTGVLCSHLLSLLVFGIIIRWKYRIPLFDFRAFSKDRCKNLLYFGGTMTASKLLKMLLDPLNKILISRFIGLSEVTFYEISLRGVRQLRSLYVKAVQAIMPRISEIQAGARNSLSRIRSIHRKSILFVLSFGLPVFGGVFLLSEFLLTTWLGDHFHILILTGFRFFLVAVYINLISVPAFNVFMGLNRVSICFQGILIRGGGYLLCILTLLILRNFRPVYEDIILMFSLSFLVSSSFYIWRYIKMMERGLNQHGSEDG